MINLIKKKNYIRPEAEATWIDNEELLGTITGSAHGQSWDDPTPPTEPDRSGAKGNNLFSEGFEPDNDDDEWGYKYESLW